MAIAKKDRFITKDLKQKISPSFPPETFKYKIWEMTILGKSNKDDLMPVNVDTAEMQRIVTLGNLDQYICTNQVGDIFDAAIYKGEDGAAYLYGIMTREKK
jgi:hypothetical protein